MSKEFNEVIDLLKNLPEADQKKHLQTRSCLDLNSTSKNGQKYSVNKLQDNSNACCFTTENSLSLTLPKRSKSKNCCASSEIATDDLNSPVLYSSCNCNNRNLNSTNVSSISKTIGFLSIEKRNF